MPHTRFKAPLRLQEKYAALAFLDAVFSNIPTSRAMEYEKIAIRDENIRQEYANGATLATLGRQYNISYQRVSQIVHAQ